MIRFITLLLHIVIKPFTAIIINIEIKIKVAYSIASILSPLDTFILNPDNFIITTWKNLDVIIPIIIPVIQELIPISIFSTKYIFPIVYKSNPIKDNIPISLDLFLKNIFVAYHIKKNKNTDSIIITATNTDSVNFLFSSCNTFIASPYLNNSKLVSTTTEKTIDIKNAR